MNKRQKEVELAKLKDEKNVLDALRKSYEQATRDIESKIEISNGKIKHLLKDIDNLTEKERSILQSQVYQREYQRSLKMQINRFIDNLNKTQYDSIEEYLNECYLTGFIGSVYDLHGQQIPLIMPIDQKQMVKAVTLDSKVSKKLYGKYTDELKKHIRSVISRGVATGLPFADIARNLNNRARVTYNQAARVARTEGHGVQCQAAWDAQHDAKKAGADVVKQWDAAMDKRTRASHARLDGEIRELDEKFSNGMKMPSDPAGGAAEVVNCRCALLQRARWALDDEELETLKERAEYFGLDKTKDFKDFKNKYLKAAESAKVEVPKVSKFTPAKTKKEAEDFAKKIGIEADYSKYDISVANAINETLQQAIDEFGEHSLDRLKTIRAFNKGETTRGQGGFNFTDGSFKIRGVSGKDSLQKMGKPYHDKFMDEYFSTDSEMHIIRHEVGHAIHASVEGKVHRDLIDYQRQRKIELRKSGESLIDVSLYAKQDEYEYVAECIAEYFDGKPRKTASDVVDIIKAASLDKKLENSANSGTIKEITVHKSLGAAAKKYTVKLADSKQHGQLAEGQTITGKTFAGKGTDKEIRERFRLESDYKIPANEWEKVSGKGYVIKDGKKVKAELHWYEAGGEMYEMKVKRYLDED